MLIRRTVNRTVPGGAALRATEHGAWSTGRVKGRLLPGMLADIAVFSRDLPTALPDLHDTSCEMTILGGRVVPDRVKETA